MTSLNDQLVSRNSPGKMRDIFAIPTNVNTPNAKAVVNQLPSLAHLMIETPMSADIHWLQLKLGHVPLVALTLSVLDATEITPDIPE